VRYVEAPVYPGNLPHPWVFLAGGITGVRDWQAEVRRILEPLPGGTMFNPRRANFPIHDPSAAQEQITWEYRNLTNADLILFWFETKETQPIVLYELGRYATLGKPLVVGAHPEYPRRQDVVIQMGLARPEIKVQTTLEETCNLVRYQLWKQTL